MTNAPCRLAASIGTALDRRSLDATERAHVRECEECAAALAGAVAIGLEQSISKSARLPTARQTLLRARLEVRRREAERRLRPITVWQTITLGVALGVAAWLLPALLDGLSRPPAGASSTPAQLAFGAGVGLLLALGSVVALRRAAA